MSLRAGKLSTNQKSRMIQLQRKKIIQCRSDDGAIFEPSLSSSTFIGFDTQKPIDLATVHSSQKIFDSTVGIIIKIRLNTVSTKCLVYLTSTNTSKSSATTPPAASCSQVIGRSNNLTSLFMVLFGLFSGFSDAFTLHGQSLY